MYFDLFGGKITKGDRNRYEASPNWKGGKFQNLIDTNVNGNLRELPKLLYKQLKGHPEGEPKKNIPIIPFDEDTFMDGHGFRYIWYGHSVVLLRMNGKTILIDPMLGPDTTPIAPTNTKRFSEGSLDVIDQLPPIDLVLLTHDHYDHLDHASMMKLKGKVKKFYVSLGSKRHLTSWGIEPEIIQEFDWWDSAEFAGVHITFTPTRHFSGRGLFSIAKCLWGGWSLQSVTERVWFSGDSGYGPHFSEVSKRLGPVDLAFMECGQYNDMWPEIHMFPDESVRVTQEVGVKVAVPVHWAGFNLSFQHSWYEPVEEFIKHAQECNQQVNLPQIGAVNTLDKIVDEPWWKSYS